MLSIKREWDRDKPTTEVWGIDSMGALELPNEHCIEVEGEPYWNWPSGIPPTRFLPCVKLPHKLVAPSPDAMHSDYTKYTMPPLSQTPRHHPLHFPNFRCHRNSMNSGKTKSWASNERLEILHTSWAFRSPKGHGYCSLTWLHMPHKPNQLWHVFGID